MANMYVLHSRLSDKEIQNIVLCIIGFMTYDEIATNTGRTIQSLRPLLNRIERRMFFDMDGWPLFHMMQLSSYNLNKYQRPYNNHIASVLECIHRIPRTEKKAGMKIEGETVDFASEVECLFACPQHLPPKPFVKKYGIAQPIGNFKAYKEQKECADRIRLKKSCRNCPSKLKDIWTADEKLHFFRFAMEYATKFGKPRKQNEDIFIARMAYYLVWRAFDMNLDEYMSYSAMRHRGQAKTMDKQRAEQFFKDMRQKDKKKAVEWKLEAMKTAAAYVLSELKADPIRLDRRAAHSDPSKS